MSNQGKDRSKLLLEEAISKLDLPTLRNVFKSMCAGSEEFRQQATELLLAPRPAVKRAATSDNPEEASASNKKQKGEDAEKVRSRYEPCVNCKQVFDVTANTKKSCRYHEGELELDQDYFPDDDQVEYDPSSIDVHTDWRRDQFPDGFIWDCCDENCNNEGCCVGKHKAAPPFVTLFDRNGNKINYDDDDDDKEDEDDEDDEDEDDE